MFTFLLVFIRTIIQSLLNLTRFGNKSSPILPLADGRSEGDGRAVETTPLLAGNSGQVSIAEGAQDLTEAETAIPVKFDDLPVEVLQQIMSFSVFSIPQPQEDAPKQCDEKALILVSSVSKGWQFAALSAHALWAVVPKITIQSVAKDKEENWFETLQLRLSRSGSASLTFILEITRAVYEERSALTRRVLSKLTEQCHRWGEATILQMPSAIFHEFNSSTQGKLVLLSKFELTFDHDRYVWDREPQAPPEPVVIDLSYAPLLKSARVNAAKDMIYPLAPQLPLGQLEHFGADIYQPSYYRDLIEARPTLRSLRCYFKTPKPVLPTINSTLPQLRLLHLTLMGGDSVELEGILKLLTTPSLTEIVVLSYSREGEHNPDASVNMGLGDQVLALIRRSGCHVRRLDLVAMRIPSSTQLYKDTILLSPHLTYLTVYSDSLQEIRNFIVPSTSTSTSSIFLPCLKFLSIVRVTGTGEHEADAAMAMLDIIWSRSRHQCQARSLIGTVQLLEEVYLEPMNGSRLQTLLGQWEHENLPPIFVDSPLKLPNTENAEMLDAIAMKAISGFFACVVLDPSVKRCEELGKVLDDLTYIRLDTCNTLPLVRRHFPWIMKQWHSRFVFEKYVATLWNRVKSLKLRMENLMEKWKPHFIEDVRNCPYRWELGYVPVAMDSGRLRCVCNTLATEDDDTVWEYLTSYPVDDPYGLLYQ